jgi:glycosyltransferase involved in cell wall biosynthesis
MKTKFSIVIPCFNEENTVSGVVTNLCMDFPDILIVVVDDGSTDKSVINLKKINYQNFNLIELGKNYGKGFAMRSGLDHIKRKSEIVIFTDADSEVNLKDLNKVIILYENNPEMMSIFGSRFINISLKTIFKMGIDRYIVNRLLTTIGNIRYGSKLTDIETAVKSFKTALIDDLKLNSNGFDIEPEIVRSLCKNNIEIHEVSVGYDPRTTKEGKKISFKDGIITLRELFK